MNWWQILLLIAGIGVSIFYLLRALVRSINRSPT